MATHSDFGMEKHIFSFEHAVTTILFMQEIMYRAHFLNFF